MSCISCEIESRSDFLTGMYLTVRIPEKDLDENALYTIQEDCPGFILPFNHKSVNGQMEFTYKVGNLCKLQYFYGTVSYAEYIALWSGILSPLLECRDWFMNPGSFILNTEYLYYDKNKKTVAYIYVPCICGCSGYDAFSAMAADIAKNIKVSDPVLENKVLSSIVNGFEPKEFLQMIQSSVQTPASPGSTNPVVQDCGRDEADSTDDNSWRYKADDEDDSGSFADPEDDLEWHSISKKKQKERGSQRVLGGKKKSAAKTKRNGYKNTVPGSLKDTAAEIPAVFGGVTQETKAVLSGTGLRCVGRAELPQIIDVDIADSGIFTIGRYDAGVGKKQSSFEFEAKTKAVSRRHAVIERSGAVYSIIDLASSAGTFVNDRKLPPNTPAILEQGCRVSFGNLGADYVWETC